MQTARVYTPGHALLQHTTKGARFPSRALSQKILAVLSVLLARNLGSSESIRISVLGIHYSSLRGAHTLCLEVHDKKDAAGEEKKDSTVPFCKKDTTGEEAHLSRGIPSEIEQCAAPANLETRDHNC